MVGGNLFGLCFCNVDSGKYIYPMINDVEPEDRGSVCALIGKYYMLRNMPDSVNYYMKNRKSMGGICKILMPIVYN